MGKTLGYGEITVANMTEPFTVMLTNEAQQFATDSNRKVTSAQSYYTDIIVIRGSQERTDYTIGNITSSSGITVSKSSKRVTFSVSAGATIRADTGVIEIPITLDGQTVKKQFSWGCGKQGPQGVKGENGSKGKSVQNVIEYYLATSASSNVTSSTNGWSTDPTTQKLTAEKKYLWNCKQTVYDDGTKGSITSPVICGTYGETGKNALQSNRTYTGTYTTVGEIAYASTSSFNRTPIVGDIYTCLDGSSNTGTWQVTAISGTNVTVKLLGYIKSKGEDGKNGADGNSFAWNMLSETNCGKKHWGTESSGGKYSVEDFITEDNINAVKLICTEAISTSNWSYVSFKDIKMLKQLKPSTKYTLSYDIKANRSGAISHSICKGDVSNFCTNTVVVNNIIGNETWQHISVVLTTNDLKTTPTNEILYLGRNALSNVGYSIIKNLKLVEGDIDTPWSPSQSDIEGKGVVETIQYYLATSQASGVTSSTSGWSTDITSQKLTADKKYLWNCYQTKYSDGTSEPISTPKVIGVYGDKGNGIVASVQRPNKTEFWWNQVGAVGHKDTFDDSSNTRNNCRVGDIFTVMGTSTEGNSHTVYYKSTTDSGDLAGECINHVVAESGADAKNLSITPSSQYFKSTDGGKTFAPDTITIKPTIQGEISFGKWQYSIDGGVSFADVVSGQKGLTISNNVLAVSKDSSLYSDAVTMVTFRAVASDSAFYDTCSIAKIYDVSDIQIGGRNLILNSDKEYVMGYGIPNTTWTDGYAYIGLPTTRLTDEILPQNNAFLLHPEAGKTYTQTIWIETDANIIDLNAAQVSWFTGKYGHVLVAAKIIKLADNSYKLTSTYTVTKGDSDIRLFDILHLFSALDISNSGTYLKFGKLKVEQGNVSTDWTPAPEDLQTAILSTKSEISDVSLKVDKNKQAIEQRVEKTTYQQDLNLVKGDISKANEGLNKWRYEIYPKSLFASEYQGKSTMDVFAKNTNLTPSQSVLINDTDFGKNWAYGDNYIGYALTFVKFSAAKSVAITFKHDDGAHLYLNGKLIGGDDTCNTGSGESLALSFIQGWNCLEVVLNEKSGGEYIGLGTTISAISECQLMNCYYGTPVARQSHITNQLVQNTTDIDGVSGSVQKVMSTVGGSGKIDEFVSNYATWKKKVDGIETRVGETYTTKDDFDDLQIGGRNLLKHSSMIGEKLICDNYFICNNCNIQEYTNDGFHIITPTEGNANNGIAFAFDNFTIMEINGGDTITFSCDIKGTSDSHAPFVSIHISDNNWYGSGVVQKNTDVSITKDWQRVSVTITTPTGLTKNHMWLAIHGNHQSDLYVRNFKLEKGNKPTDWTPAPEDVNGKIVNVETIANQTANKFQWIVKGGDSSSNFTLTDRVADLVAERINFKGLVTFSGLNTDVKNEIGKVAQSKVDGLEVGGRNLIINSNLSRALTNVTNDGCSNMTVVSDSVYGHALKFTAVNQRRVFWATSNVWVRNKTYTVSFVAKSSVTGQKIRPSRSTADWGDDITLTTSYARYTTKITSWDTNVGGTLSFSCTNAVGDITITNVKLEVGNKATDWTPAPEDVSQDATNKASQALTDAKNYSSNAVNWVTSNGSSTTSLNSMVKKWTDGAVSDTAQINGGWIKANTITASKIAVGDFTNYADINESNTYWFRTEQTKEGTWFYRDGSELQRDNVISELHTCRGGETFYVEYDISNTIKEGDEYKYAGLMIFGYDGNGGNVSYNRNAGVTATANGEITHITTQLTMPDTTRSFRVYLQIEGQVPFTGTLKIRNISVRKATTGKLIVDGSITADKIATDAIKSRNYISSGGTQGSFLNLSDGSFTSPNLSWDSNGNLIASNANLSGLINATKGTVGGWNIATNGLYSGIDENAIKIYSATTYDAQTMYQKQKIQDSFILSQKYINHFVSQQVSVGHNIPYWQTRSFIYNDSQIQLAQSDYCINTSSASNYDAQYSLKDGYISATRIYMEQNITQVGGDVINSSFSIGLDSMMGWCSIQSTKGINIYGNSSRALYVQSNDTSKYNALETEGDVVVNGKIHAVSGDNKIQLNSDNNGSIELYGNTPFIDFHSAYSSADYTCRIIANTPEQLLVCGKLRCDSNIISNNDLIANSWVYAGQNAHYTWQNQLDCYFSCGYYNNTNNVYYYAGYHAFYVNNDSGSGMMYINTNGVTSRVGFTKTSDERIKKNFESFDDNIIDAYMNIEPVKYQLKQSSNDNYHFGFKAQHIDKIFSDYGDTYNESFDICTSRPIDPDKAKELYGVDGMVEEYGLRYDELIAPTTYMVQHIYKELEQVRQEKADLEARLQAIEAKLGF